MRLRQIAFVAEHLKGATEELCSLLGLEVAYRDPGVGKWGLENIVAPIGGDFLEIVAPTQPGTSAGRYLQRRQGDGGYMVILQVADALSYRKRLQAMGVRAVATRDQRDYTYTHFHPADVGGFLLSIDAGAPEDDWRQKLCNWVPAGPDWKSHLGRSGAGRLLGVELQSADPVATADLWGRLLERPVKSGKGGLHIPLDMGEVRFVEARDGRGSGISALDIEVADKAATLAAARARGRRLGESQIEVVGCRINLA
ncbi:MAG: VOC family protein [Reyranellaceae bacterium]